MIRGYDAWKLDTPDNHVVEIGECPVCGYVIYKGEDHVEIDMVPHHTDCEQEEEEE